MCCGVVRLRQAVLSAGGMQVPPTVPGDVRERGVEGARDSRPGVETASSGRAAGRVCPGGGRGSRPGAKPAGQEVGPRGGDRVGWWSCQSWWGKGVGAHCGGGGGGSTGRFCCQPWCGGGGEHEQEDVVVAVWQLELELELTWRFGWCSSPSGTFLERYWQPVRTWTAPQHLSRPQTSNSFARQSRARVQKQDRPAGAWVLGAGG